MSKFKVDKLGWYKTRLIENFDTEVKILHKMSDNTYLAVDYFYKFVVYYNEDGKYISSDFPELDLVSYIGEELPVKKEPRKFEFEAEIDSFINTDLHFTLKNENIYIKQDGARWKVTMEEIIE